MEPIAVESNLTHADWAALQQVWGERQRQRVGKLQLLGAILTPLVTGVVVLSVLGSRHEPLPFAGFAVGLLGMLGSVLAMTSLFRRSSLPDEDGLVLGNVRMELSDEGISTRRASSSGVTQWSALRGVTRTDTHLFLWVDRLSAYILPLRDLPEGIDAEAVLQAIRAFAGPAATLETGPASAAVWAPPSGVRHRFFPTLARRLAWRPVPDDGGSGDSIILACAVAALVVWLAFDRHAAGAGAQWYPGGAAGLAWYAMGVLGLAWVLHRAASEKLRFRTLVASIVGALPLALALGLAIRAWAPAAMQAPGYWLVAIAAAIQLRLRLTAMSGRRQPLALLAGTLFALLFSWATSQAWVYPHFWYAADDESEDGGTWADSERRLFEQADRIDAAAARLRDGAVGRPDVFFVGFAGVAEQKVFAEELKLSESVVTQRYGAAGRSLLLVNDRRDRDTWPLATVHGLRRALARTGERMDRDDDVLFLMLTSHGSDAPSLSVSNGSWPLEGLGGKALRTALDESGIRWRVIVISACHSAAFIEPLADENTIVLTSAAKDRTSFGCSDDRDLTYFGTAFIKDALPAAESLASAFDRAKRAIAEQEAREGLGASAPQAHFGRAISAHWERIEEIRRAASPR
jgi:hypothetical protein